jgi:tRNA (guanine-N7-)-methyltransferase
MAGRVDHALGRTKPPPDRLYGRGRGHKLRARQETLLELTLPRLAFPLARSAEPLAAFAPGLRRLWLEVGFGGGEHALAQIAAHPDTALIACEVFDNGICSLLSRLVPAGPATEHPRAGHPPPLWEATAPLPGNLRLWPEDARVLLRALPDASLNRLFLLFPDPWPKARHAKRRFVHPMLLAELARVLTPGAMWRVASDDPTYQSWVTEVMGEQTLFDTPAPATVRPADWPPTRYEAKALLAGRMPLYWTFVRR